MRIRPTWRDLFWSLLVVALSVGWAIDHQRITEDADRKLSDANSKISAMITDQEELRRYVSDSMDRWRKNPQGRMPIMRPPPAYYH